MRKISCPSRQYGAVHAIRAAFTKIKHSCEPARFPNFGTSLREAALLRLLPRAPSCVCLGPTSSARALAITASPVYIYLFPQKIVKFRRSEV
jgi:hypothetical protein